MLRVGIDIGGTFTDFIAWQDDGGAGRLRSFKVPSTPPNYEEGFIAGLTQVLAAFEGVGQDDIMIMHGTTISTNTVIERSAEPVALLTTRGFRDILNIQRLRLRNPTNLFEQRAEPLVPRELVFEIDERLNFDGSVRRAIDPAEVVAAAREAFARGAGGIAVAFYHSYRNPAHEEAARAALAEAFPDLHPSLSSEIWPQIGEYERAMAAVLNAYVQPKMSRYVSVIESWLAENLPRARLYITRSNGGAMSIDEARRFPVQTLLSGPASGVTAALALSERMGGSAQYLTFDMGGTSTDVSLVRGSRPLVSTTSEVGDFPVSMPVTDIEAIGAGGGSIIGIDKGVLRVGPQSAGARPGPAAFGRGGTLPTVSDAYVLSGYLDPENFLGGRMKLDVAAAERAMKPIAEALGTSVSDAAEAALNVASSNMIARVMPYMARNGVDPEDLTLIAFGGAGSLHAPLLAVEMGIRHVLIPPTPAVFCASGGLVARLVNDMVLTVHGQKVDGTLLNAGFADLRRRGQDWLAAQADPSMIVSTGFDSFVEARYVGQSFQIQVEVPPAALAGDIEALKAAFHAEHERRYSHADPGQPVEFLQLRLRISGDLPHPAMVRTSGAGDAAVALTGARDIRLGGRVLRADVYDRRRLTAGARVRGPAIVEQEDTTILVPDAFTAVVNGYDDLVISKE